jgi:hypothetical protein
MKNDNILKSLFSLAKQSNRLVYEISDVFGDKLGIEELEYWMVFNVISSAEINSVNIKELGFEDAVDEIDRVIKEKQSKWKRK